MALNVGRRATDWTAAAAGLVTYLLAQPVLGVSRELAIGVLAYCVSGLVSSGWWQPAVNALRLDPIYAGVAIRSLGTIQPQGVAVAGPLGAMLHALLPAVFATPDKAIGGVFASLVVAPGASVLEHSLLTLIADMLVLLFGLACAAYASRRMWLLLFGLLVQAQIVVGHLLSLRVGASDLEATGAPVALAVVFPSAGWWLPRQLEKLSQPWQGAIIGAALVILAYAVAIPVLLSVRGLSRMVGGTTGPQWRALAVGSVLAIATMYSPVGAWARVASNWQTANLQVPPAAAVMPRPVASYASRSSMLGPHTVALAQDPGGNWHYLVDGTPEAIRGIGYNPQYAGLHRSERANLYQRDFSEIRSIGANTIEGWYDNQFDQLTLEYAARNGLGVILPYRLDHDWDYSDPGVQERILQDVSRWVRQYRNSAALRMWAPGNENLHRMLYSKWVSQEQLPRATAEAQAFAVFLPRLIDRIHELDPNHPIVYRDAEDVYVPCLQQGFSQQPRLRPWFVYGANVYSPSRLRQIMDNWPGHGLSGPLLISEFAPVGGGPAGRALGYAQEWQQIRTDPGFVLGGLAYAWATNGPEQLDRVFGLVDPSGAPCDAALAELSSLYQKDAQAAGPSPSASPRGVATSG